MIAFGIRTAEFGDSDQHYVGDDGSLFDWLISNNYEPSDRDSLYLVKAPDGYLFYKASLFPEDSAEVQGDDGKNVSDSAYVTFGSPENDKALMLLEGAMRYVEPDEFYALNLAEDRILDYQIY
jgi:hypothetical protein